MEGSGGFVLKCTQGGKLAHSTQHVGTCLQLAELGWQSYTQNDSACLQRSLYDCSVQVAGMTARMLMLNV